MTGVWDTRGSRYAVFKTGHLRPLSRGAECS